MIEARDLFLAGLAKSRAIEASQREDQHAAELYRVRSRATVKRCRAKRDAAYLAVVREAVA